MNVVALVGRLTKDPELKFTPSGVATCTYLLAVDDPFAKQDPKADFINIVAWKQLAELCANYLKKGHRCSVEGRIKTRKYEKDGRTIYIVEVLASGVRFLEPANKSESRSEQPANQDPFKDEGQPVDISDDDLPF